MKCVTLSSAELSKVVKWKRIQKKFYFSLCISENSTLLKILVKTKKFEENKEGKQVIFTLTLLLRWTEKIFNHGAISKYTHSKECFRMKVCAHKKELDKLKAALEDLSLILFTDLFAFGQAVFSPDHYAAWFSLTSKEILKESLI